MDKMALKCNSYGGRSVHHASMLKLGEKQRVQDTSEIDEYGSKIGFFLRSASCKMSD